MRSNPELKVVFRGVNVTVGVEKVHESENICFKGVFYEYKMYLIHPD